MLVSHFSHVLCGYKREEEVAARNRNHRRAGRLQEQGGTFEAWMTCVALCTEAWGRAHFRVVGVQSPRRVQLLANPMDCSTPGLSSPSAFNVLPSIRVFSSESVLCISWPKY